MEYFIGIDIGTTATKAVVFSTSGQFIKVQRVAYPIHSPQAAYQEQDPQVLLQAVVTSLQAILSEFGFPKMICFSAAMHSLIALDKSGQTLSPLITWADTRSSVIAQSLKEQDIGRAFYESSGTPIHPMNPVCKIKWLAQNDPVLFQKTAYFVSFKAYLFFQLFGVLVEDEGLASASGLMDTRQGGWNEAVLNYLQISSEQLPEIVAVESCFYDLQKDWQKRLGLNAKVPFLIGGADGCLANLGTLALGAEAAVMSIGTSGAIRKCSLQFQTDIQANNFCYRLDRKRYIIGGATNNGGIVLQWLLTQFFSKESLSRAYENIHKVEDIPPGAEGLLFLPYLLGERAPIWEATARGAYLGLTKNHTKWHQIRALMEGILFNLKQISSSLNKEVPIELLYVTGGFTQMNTWVQMCADIFGLPVLVTSQKEQAAFGAVLLGMKQYYGWEDYTPAKAFQKIAAHYEPDTAKYQIYEEYYQLFRTLYPKLRGEMQQLHRLNHNKNTRS